MTGAATESVGVDIIIWSFPINFVMEVRAHVLFYGQVQGVYFRDNTRRKAEDLGVVGWVRNLRDGSVEAVLEGPQEPVEALIEWCRTSQPYARVAEAKVSWDEYQGSFDTFSVRR